MSRMEFTLKVGVMQSSYFRQWLENNSSDAVRASPHPTELDIRNYIATSRSEIKTALAVEGVNHEHLA
jgi:hypothetical protein